MNEIEKTPEGNYRVDSATVRSDWLLLLLLAGDLVYGAISLTQMPERVPVHWNLDGVADRFGSPWVNALMLPGVALAMWALLLLMPLFDPRRRNYALFSDTLRFVRWLTVLFLIGLHILVIRISLGDDIDIGFAIRLGLGLLTIAIGNRMGKMRQNYFLGIRVPWTIASEEVWNRTHRMAGWLWVIGGMALVASAFLPGRLAGTVFTAIMVVLVVVPTFYSWWLYRQLGLSARKP